MFDKPILFYRRGCFEIYVPVAQANQLCLDLTQSNFQVKKLAEEFGAEDCIAETRTEIVVLELPGSTDKIALRRFLREKQTV